MRLNVHSHKVFFYWFSSSNVKINFCPGYDLQTVYPSEADAYTENVLDDPNSDELNWASSRTFHELHSQSLVRLMKSSTFGLGLRPYNLSNQSLLKKLY